MATDKERILKMLEEGKITAEDATRLLHALGAEDEKKQAAQPRADLKGKKLRVKVEGIDKNEGDGEQKINVNITLPLALAKLADGIITNVIPKEVNKELESEGIDLKALNIGEIIDTLSDLDEDIVNVDAENNGKPMKVRVYVE